MKTLLISLALICSPIPSVKSWCECVEQGITDMEMSECDYLYQKDKELSYQRDCECRDEDKEHIKDYEIMGEY